MGQSFNHYLFVEKQLFTIFCASSSEYCIMSVPQVPPTDRNALSSLWGKLASEILMQNWEAAMEDLTRLRETIDNNVNAPFLEFSSLILTFCF